MALDTAPPPTRRAPRPTHAPRPQLPHGWRGLVVTALLVVGTLIALLLFITVLERWWYRGRVLPSVEVMSVDVSGAGETRTRTTITEAARIIETDAVTGRVGEQTLSMAPALIDTRVDVDASVLAARRAGRSRNPVDAVFGTVLRRIRPDRVPLRVRHDDRKLNGVVSNWVDQASAGRANAQVQITGTTVTVVPPATGVGIEPEATKIGILAALPRTEQRTVSLRTGRAAPDVSLEEATAAAAKVRAILGQPVTVTVSGTPLTLSPEKIAPTLGVIVRDQDLAIVVDPAKLRSAFGAALTPFEKAPVNASFAVNGATVSVVPSQSGVQVDLDAVGLAIGAGQHTISANPRPVEPTRTTEWAQRMNITEMVSTFTTQHPAGQERVKNIRRAADVVQNAVVEPGQVFSLNDTLGRRTAASGYVMAPVYVDGEFKDDFGGGVSQFTTTLYNATFFGGYKDIEHAPHSIYISRYPMGREATLNYGSIDLRFQNDTKSGLLIRTSYTASSITVTLYGNKEGRSVKAEGPNVLEKIEPETEYVDDPTLKPGTEKEVEAGHPRIVVENFRIISRPGQPDKRERYVWTYEMMKRKVARNTAPPPGSSTTSTTKPR